MHLLPVSYWRVQTSVTSNPWELWTGALDGQSIKVVDSVSIEQSDFYSPTVIPLADPRHAVITYLGQPPGSGGGGGSYRLLAKFVTLDLDNHQVLSMSAPAVIDATNSLWAGNRTVLINGNQILSLYVGTHVTPNSLCASLIDIDLSEKSVEGVATQTLFIGSNTLNATGRVNNMALDKLSTNRAIAVWYRDPDPTQPFGQTKDCIVMSIIDVLNDTITAGPEEFVAEDNGTTASNEMWALEVVALTPTRAVILYSGPKLDGSGWSTFAKLVDVTSNTPVVLHTLEFSGYSNYTYADKLTSSRVIVTHQSGNSNTYSTVLEMQGDTLTSLSQASMPSGNISYNYANVIPLDDKRAMYVYTGNYNPPASYQYGKAHVMKYDGRFTYFDTVAWQESVQVAGAWGSPEQPISAALVGKNHMLMFYEPSETKNGYVAYKGYIKLFWNGAPEQLPPMLHETFSGTGTLGNHTSDSGHTWSGSPFLTDNDFQTNINQTSLLNGELNLVPYANWLSGVIGIKSSRQLPGSYSIELEFVVDGNNANTSSNPNGIRAELSLFFGTQTNDPYDSGYYLQFQADKNYTYVQWADQPDWNESPYWEQNPGLADGTHILRVDVSLNLKVVSLDGVELFRVTSKHSKTAGDLFLYFQDENFGFIKPTRIQEFEFAAPPAL